MSSPAPASGRWPRVGTTEISPEEFRQAYQDEIASISRRLGRRLTPEQAKHARRRARARLSRLIGSAAVDTHARELGLAVSDSDIADVIRADPAFQGSTGSSSNARFNEVLRQNGIERGAATSRSAATDEMREQLTDACSAAPSRRKLADRDHASLSARRRA